MVEVLVTDLPEDPFGDCLHSDDACSAIGIAVLEVLNKGYDFVIITREGTDYTVSGHSLDEVEDD